MLFHVLTGLVHWRYSWWLSGFQRDGYIAFVRSQQILWKISPISELADVFYKALISHLLIQKRQVTPVSTPVLVFVSLASRGWLAVRTLLLLFLSVVELLPHSEWPLDLHPIQSSRWESWMKSTATVVTMILMDTSMVYTNSISLATYSWTNNIDLYIHSYI